MTTCVPTSTQENKGVCANNNIFLFLLIHVFKTARQRTQV